MFYDETEEPELINVKLFDADGQPFYEEDGDTQVSMDITRDQYDNIQRIAELHGVTFDQAFAKVLQDFLKLETDDFQSDIGTPLEHDDEEV